jgi:hypothetical protein
VRRTGRLLGTALFLLVANAAVGVTPVSATPLPIGDCTTTRNVILAVDFGHWGGPVLRSCDTANGTTDTGFHLLNEGGWSTVGDQHDGPAFICRIGYSGYQGGTGYPTAAQDPCVLTPPASAYWSYWHANPGQNTWSYSQLGAMSYRPTPGSVDLWTFGATDIAGTQGLPPLSPDALRAHNTTPNTTAPPQPKPPVATTRAHANPPAPAGTTRPAPTSSAAAGPTATTSGAAGTGTTTPPPILDAQPRAIAPHNTGSALPVILGGALVLVLAAGSVALVLRRRSRR